eukprot:7990705-Pyramimonas_sp.AAC.1
MGVVSWPRSGMPTQLLKSRWGPDRSSAPLNADRTLSQGSAALHGSSDFVHACCDAQVRRIRAGLNATLNIAPLSGRPWAMPAETASVICKAPCSEAMVSGVS